MRISDWSSDVCSSDLLPDPRRLGEAPGIPSPASLLRRRAGFDLRPHPFAVPAASASHQGSMDERAVAAHDQAALRTQLHTPRNLHATRHRRSEEHTSELQSLMRISYAVFCLKKNIRTK